MSAVYIPYIIGRKQNANMNNVYIDMRSQLAFLVNEKITPSRAAQTLQSGPERFLTGFKPSGLIEYLESERELPKCLIGGSFLRSNR